MSYLLNEEVLSFYLPYASSMILLKILDCIISKIIVCHLKKMNLSYLSFVTASPRQLSLDLLISARNWDMQPENKAHLP